MIMFTRCLFLVAFVLFSVSALPLASRDVVDPPITSPTASTIWHVGTTQTVTWNTTGLPVNQTNPTGMLVLGYVYNNSENLMLDSPLATNIKYSVGQVQITVPNVPTRSDYIVVLFGDSGNASPQFTIINDASSSTSAAPSPATTGSPGSTPGGGSTPVSSPTGSSPPPPNSVGGPSATSPLGALNTGSGATATTPSSQPTGSHTSTVLTLTASATPSSTQSNAAGQKHTPGLWTCLSTSLALIYFSFA